MATARNVTIGALSISPTVQRVSLAGYCARACGAGSCPEQQLRSLALQLTGRAIADAGLARSVHSEVRLRNDTLTGNCPT